MAARDMEAAIEWADTAPMTTHDMEVAVEWACLDLLAIKMSVTHGEDLIMPSVRPIAH